MSVREYLSPDKVSEALKNWLREPDEPDRVYPKNKKIEVVFLVEAVNAILPRTEGVEDITLTKLPGTEYEVPTILPEKLQAVTRRRMLAQLRRYRDEKPENLKQYLKTLANLFEYTKGGKSKSKNEKVVIRFKKAEVYSGNPKDWNCYIQPPGGDATDVGMDGFCPACTLFGTVITNNVLEFYDTKKDKNIFGESVGIKSRVEFDPAVAFVDQEKSVADYTHNKVADGASWTGQSLYTEHHVAPGTLFVGKVTLEDVTEVELKAFLAVLATIDRLGGRERVYGGVRIHLIGIRGGSYETVSALEIARLLAKEYGEVEYPPAVEVVKEKVWNTIQNYGFQRIESKDFKKLMDNMNLWDNLWDDTVKYDKRIVERILRLIRGGNFEPLE